MSMFGPLDSPTTPTRELRRLAHSTVVPTSYVSREPVIESAEALRAEAARQGYEDGHAEGLAQAVVTANRERDEESRRVAAALAALSRALGAAHEAEVKARAEIQRAAPKLAFALLEELLGREVELAINPGFDAITRVLALDEGVTPATVRMNPGDIETLGNVAELGLAREVCVVPDSAIEPGGALVEIGKVTLDAQLGTALARVRRVLLGREKSGAGDDRAA